MAKEDFIVRAPKNKAQAKPTKMDREKEQRAGKPSATNKRKATTMAAKKDDKKQDAKVMKGMTPAQKAKFQKEDKKMDKKPMSRKEDAKKDAALAKKVKGKK